MSEKFDPYHQWLGIPVSEQPPNHYRLLGVPLLEESPTVIASAADRQMAHLRTFQTGQNSALSQKLLNEVSLAKVCLLNPKKKAEYDRQFRQRNKPGSGATDRSPAASLDLGFASLPTTRTPSAAVRRRKTARPKPTVLIGATVLTVALAGSAGLWWVFGHDSPPGHEEIAKGAAPSTSARPAQQASPKFQEPSKHETRVAASTAPKGELPAEVPKAGPGPNPPVPSEPKADEASPI